jgi:hypothetical protein
VAAGEAAEAVVEKFCVCGRADVGRHEDPRGIETDRGGVVGDDVFLVVSKVGLAAIEEVGARFPEDIFHALGEEECETQTKGQSHPSS